MTCPFCAWKKLRHQCFYETQNFVCFYNIRPVFPGHSLIIPKRHMTTILKMNEDEIEEFPSVVKLVMTILKKAYKTDGFNIVLQEGRAAGATIDHVHFHILPRHKGDTPKDVDWETYFYECELKRRKLTNAEMNREVKKIKKQLP